MIPDFVKKLMLFNKLKWENGNILVQGSVMPFIMPSESFIFLRDEMIKKMGDKGKKIMKDTGRLQGSKGAKRHKTIKNIDKTLSKIESDPQAQMAVQFFEIAGLGKCRLKYLKSEETLLLMMENSIIAKTYLKLGEKKGEPVCEYFEGMIEGTFSEITGKKSSCKETSCMAQGKPNCTFKLTVSD
jgi:predicted hydrocarbon binding protein